MSKENCVEGGGWTRLVCYISLLTFLTHNLFDIGKFPGDAHQNAIHILHFLLKTNLLEYMKDLIVFTHWEFIICHFIDIITFQLHVVQIFSFGRVETFTEIRQISNIEMSVLLTDIFLVIG